ncbi:ABC transporter family substrate-binding protein [Isoptericola sp. b441]|uniref:ABC transporter family substrate-binding protein n=1 Tax=Actinotalea lenta TaxID=3064654 RepID=A0ABT9D8J4_9CELL|nr:MULTISPECIES: ABC transporter family substrate-binding protein [unclassified Isoptericola]MDO8106870.1 ABC transporter family substrate-binding protein [Isoptericola sp. b441]MDO8121420.1 ABC transporter family substrate-binding protein [Isoptericola sp. b490]
MSAVAALVGASALALAACSNSPANTPSDSASGSSSSSSSGPTGTVTVAEVNTFFSFNPNTSNGNVDINSKISLATSSNFWYIDDKLKVQKDTSFGTYTVDSEDPLTVTYTINDGVVWSDGKPVDNSDLLLAWAVESGYFNTKDHSFDYAGDTGTLGLTSFPKLGDDGRSITLTYSKPAADWEVSYSLQGMPPAHVVAEKAGLADSAALVDLMKGEPAGSDNKTSDQMAKVMDFWNTGFDSTTLPSDPSLYLSDGPFIVSDVQENQSVTMTVNDKYVGDHQPKVSEIIMRSIADSTSQVQALQNGEIDVAAPQSSADTLQALQGLTGVNVYTGYQLAYDHIDLTFNNGGPFDPATYGGDAKKAALVREAFLKTVPRQAILQAVVIPQKPDAEILNSQIFVPAQDGYAESVKNNGSDAFPGEPDIEGAKKLLQEAGVTSPTVSILYKPSNPNRVDDFTLISQSATKAGFKIKDDGDEKWGSRLGDGSYDSTIFGWINSGVGVSGVPQIFSTDGGGNFNGYSNSKVDSLASELLVTLDQSKQVSLEQQIDALVWGDYYGLPLYQSPGVVAVADRMKGVDTFNSNQNGVWWNTWDWSVSNG